MPMKPEMSRACAMAIKAAELARLHVATYADTDPDDDLGLWLAGYDDALTVSLALDRAAVVARQAMLRAADPTPQDHPALVALRGGA